MTTKNNAENVSVGKPKATGAIFAAPKGTAVPKDATTALSNAYENVGYADGSGITSAVKADSSEIKAWGGDTVLTVQTSHSETFKITCIETNINVLKEFYGEDNVAMENNTLVIKSMAGDAVAHPWVIELLMNAGRIQRIVIPNGKLSERGDIAYTDGDAIKYEMTITALPDSDGVKSYRYIASPVASDQEDK